MEKLSLLNKVVPHQWWTLMCSSCLLLFLACLPSLSQNSLVIASHVTHTYHPSPWMVSKTWVINLDERRDRMAAIGDSLVSMHVPYERFPAVNFHHGTPHIAEMVYKTRLHPNTSMDLTVIRKQMQNQRPGFNWGSVGCWQSHLQVYYEIADGPARHMPGPFLILEDDATFVRNISDYLSHRYLYRHIPRDWDILMLANGYVICHNDTTYDDYCLASQSLTTTGYLLRNHTVAQRLVDIYNTKSANIADICWLPYFEKKILKAYVILTRPIRPNYKSPSDIKQVSNATVYH